MKIFEDNREYTRDEVREILKANGRKYADLWPYVLGWSLKFGTEPNWMTPAGGRTRIFA